MTGKSQKLNKYFKIEIFVPKSHLQSLKTELFTAGCGKFGNYEQCSWETDGKGHFMPVYGSNPFIGQLNQLEIVNETLLVTLFNKKDLKKVINAIKKSHPYETPAYYITEILLTEID